MFPHPLKLVKHPITVILSLLHILSQTLLVPALDQVAVTVDRGRMVTVSVHSFSVIVSVGHFVVGDIRTSFRAGVIGSLVN